MSLTAANPVGKTKKFLLVSLTTDFEFSNTVSAYPLYVVPL